MASKIPTKSYDAHHMTSDQVDFEVSRLKKQVELDSKKLKYKEMSDRELRKNQQMSYSFRFMETSGDKDLARHAM